MRKYVISAISFLHGALLIWSFMPLIAAIFELITGKGAGYFLLSSALLLIPFTVSLIASDRCNGMGLFLLFSLLSIVPVVLFAKGLASKIVLGLVSLLIIVIRITGRVKKQPDMLQTPHIIVSVIFVLLFLFSLINKNTLLQHSSYCVCFIYLILCMIYRNLTRLDEYLTINADVANIPIRQISRTNTGLMIAYTVVTAAAMILLPLTGLDQLIAKLGPLILKVIRKLFSMINLKSEEGGTQQYETEAADENPMGAIDELIEVKETPAWMKTASKVVAVIMITACAALVLWLIWLAVKALIRQFYRPKKEKTDELEFIFDEKTQEKGFAGFFDSRPLPLFLDFSEKGRIRRRYRRAVLKTRVKIDRDSMTPSEIEAFAGIADETKKSGLHALYEEARYSK